MLLRIVFQQHKRKWRYIFAAPSDAITVVHRALQKSPKARDDLLVKGDALQYAKRVLDRSTIGVTDGVTSRSLTKAIPISHQLVTLRQHLAACGYYPYKRKPTAAPISSWTVRSDLITPWPKTRALMVWSPQPSRRNERACAPTWGTSQYFWCDRIEWP